MYQKPGFIVAITFSLQILVLHQKPALASSDFSVYCSSNMDGTGICTKEGTSESLTCVILQGSIVGCENSNRRYRCVQYGQIIANQTQFSCKETDAMNAEYQEKQKTESMYLQPPSQSDAEMEIDQPNFNPFDQSPSIPQSNILEGVY